MKKNITIKKLMNRLLTDKQAVEGERKKTARNAIKRK